MKEENVSFGRTLYHVPLLVSDLRAHWSKKMCLCHVIFKIDEAWAHHIFCALCLACDKSKHEWFNNYVSWHRLKTFDYEMDRFHVYFAFHVTAIIFPIYPAFKTLAKGKKNYGQISNQFHFVNEWETALCH